MKSRIIYIPFFDDNLIRKCILHDGQVYPGEYFTSFVKAKKELIAYHQSCILEQKVMLRQAIQMEESNV